MSKKIIETKLKDIFGFLDIDPTLEITVEKKKKNSGDSKDDDSGKKGTKKTKGTEETYTITIEGDDLSFLIGRYGKGLESLQSLLSLMLFKEKNEWSRLTLDINGYRQQRIEKLQNMAKKFIDRVRFFNNEVELPPMAPWERRQIHMLVTEYDDIDSESFGDGYDRRVILKIKEAK